MTPAILKWFRTIRPLIASPGRVLEVGALNVNGSVRQFFMDAKEYIGVDQMDGEGVDKILNAEELVAEFGRDTFDTVIACETLEHVKRPLVVAEQMRGVLRAGGWMFVTSPDNGFPIHRYPRDYWRLLPDAYEDLVFAEMEIVAHTRVGIQGDACLCYAGRKR